MLFDSKGSYDQRNEKELKKKNMVHTRKKKKKTENGKLEVGRLETGRPTSASTPPALPCPPILDRGDAVHGIGSN